MKFSAAALIAVATGASAFQNVTYTTEVVTAITTFCPAATELTHAGTTYTISSVGLRPEGGVLTRLGIGRRILGRRGCARRRDSQRISGISDQP